MADRFEYPYLTDRSAAANYFWNIGVIVTGKYLEKFLPGSAAVVLSHGASSGYPAGFIDFVSRRYKLHAAGNVSVWVLNRPPPAVK
jgi:hypothetical protein